jgi:hypothetical protein
MARKKLLTETEVRRFMKLANMDSIGDAKIEEYGGMAYARDDDAEDELGAEDQFADEEADELGAEESPLDVGVDLGAEGEPAIELSPEQATAVEDVIAAAVDELVSGLSPLGVQISVDGGEEDLEAEVGLEEPLGGGEELDVTADVAEVPPGEEDLGEPGGAMPPLEEDTDALVNEVARRVAQRISAQNRKAKMVDELTERIFDRLTQK